MSNQPLVFEPLTRITTLKRRAVHNFVRRQELFTFRLSAWFVMGLPPEQPDHHQDTSPSHQG